VEVKEKVFPCLNCGSDTGCPNKLICDKCRVSRKQKMTLARNLLLSKRQKNEKT